MVHDAQQRRLAALMTLLGLFALQLPDGSAAAPATETAQTERAVTIDPQASAVLRKCRSWIFFRTCRSYARVAMPSLVAVGDQLQLSYGSNPKQVLFVVRAITVAGNSCRLDTADQPADRDTHDSVTVTPCAVSNTSPAAPAPAAPGTP
jgi:hypothetical protein